MNPHPKDVVDYDCKDCDLWKHRTQVVWGDGGAGARIGFIGEGPGREEDETGRAFVGKAGRFLRKILKLFRINKSRMVILNLVKCRPPNNRPPKEKEVSACRKYLDRQLETLEDLRVIVVLGRVPWKFLTGEELPVTQYHGKSMKIGNLLYIYTYHPSYLARGMNKEILKQFIKDIRKAITIAGDCV